MHPQADDRHARAHRFGARREGARAGDGTPRRGSAGARDLARPGFGLLVAGGGGGSRREPLPRHRALDDGCEPSRHAGQPRCLHPMRVVRARLPRGAGERRHRHGLSECGRQGGVRFRRSDGRLHLRRLRRMRPGVPDRRAHAGLPPRREPDAYRVARPQGGFALSLLRRRLPGHLRGEGRSDRRRRGARRAGEPRAAMRERTLRLRLRAASAPADEAADPAAERGEACGRHGRPGESVDAFPRGDLGGGAGPGRVGPPAHPRRARTGRARGLRFRQGLERGGVSVPEARAHRLPDQQRGPLHPPLPCLVGRRAHGGAQFGGRDGAVRGGARRGGDPGRRRQSGHQSSCGGDLHQERREAARREAHRDGSAPAAALAACVSASRLHARDRRCPPQRDAPHDHRGGARG